MHILVTYMHVCKCLWYVDKFNTCVCRYFQCPPQHGLFAPLPRVEKIPGQPPAPQAKRSSVSHQPLPPLQNAVTPAEPATTAAPPQQSPRGSIGVSPASSMNRGAQLRKTWSSSTIGSVTSDALINRQQVNININNTYLHYISVSF